MITYRDFVVEYYDEKGIEYMRAPRNHPMRKHGFSLYWIHLRPEVRARRIVLPRNGDEVLLEPWDSLKAQHKRAKRKKVAKFILIGRRATGYVQFYENPV